MAPSDSSRPRVPHSLRSGPLPRGPWRGALLVGCAALALFGCTSKLKDTVGGGGGGGGTPPAATIQIVQSAATKGMLAFSPDTVTVHVNDTVRMHNGDSIVHDIEPLSPVSGSPVWGQLSAGQNADFQATVTGTFTYVCAIPGHNMLGTVVVQP